MAEQAMIHVVKLGGSLLDMPDLVERFNQWRLGIGADRLLMVVGGGRAADVVRHWDSMHSLDETQAHWFAIRGMQLNAYLVQSVIQNSQVVYDLSGAEAAWRVRSIAIVDPHLWLRTNEMNGRHVPHNWNFTSDSISAHIATQIKAYRLTLLKSAMDETVDDLVSARQADLVDDEFPEAAKDVPCVSLVNLRSETLQVCDLQ